VKVQKLQDFYGTKLITRFESLNDVDIDVFLKHLKMINKLIN